MHRAIYIRAVAECRPTILRQAMDIIDDAADAEDIVQEVLLKLWLMRERFKEDGEIKRMAAVMTRNLCLNHNRQQKSQTVIALGQADDIIHNNTPESARIEKDNDELIAQAANNISDRHRAVLRLRNVEGLSYSEIAALLATSESSVRGMMAKARMEMPRQLRRNMK